MIRNKKGVCTYKKGFYGWITVSEKGQIAIPIDARREIDIKSGDKLLVLSRKDGRGIMLLKPEIMDEIFEKIREEGGDF